MFRRAAAAQAVAVTALFALLVLAPLPDDFFRDFGAMVGPLAWIACSLVSARLLSLPAPFALLCALGSGLAAAAVAAAASHLAGLVLGVVVFGALCALHRRAGATPTTSRAERAGSRP